MRLLRPMWRFVIAGVLLGHWIGARRVAAQSVTLTSGKLGATGQFACALVTGDLATLIGRA